MLDQFPTGPVSVVSDSYDIFKACRHIWGDKLKERVIERSEDSCLIIRPDSGDPAETLIEVGEHTPTFFLGSLIVKYDLASSVTGLGCGVGLAGWPYTHTHGTYS